MVAGADIQPVFTLTVAVFPVAAGAVDLVDLAEVAPVAVARVAVGNNDGG